MSREEEIIEEIEGRLARIGQLEKELAELTPKVDTAVNPRIPYRLQERYSSLKSEYERLSGKRYGVKTKQLNNSGG